MLKFFLKNNKIYYFNIFLNKKYSKSKAGMPNKSSIKHFFSFSFHALEFSPSIFYKPQ
jgi:hypothetical protein